MLTTGFILELSGTTCMTTGGPSNNGQTQSLASSGIATHHPYDLKGVSGANESRTTQSSAPPSDSVSSVAHGGIPSAIAINPMPSVMKARFVMLHMITNAS